VTALGGTQWLVLQGVKTCGRKGLHPVNLYARITNGEAVLDELVALGFATHHGERYFVTEKGRAELS